MIVLGDISGIQNYLFDVADTGGGQSRRLRARSFFLQVLPDIAAIRIMRELGWGFDAVRMAGAGKFVLYGTSPVTTDACLREIDSDLNRSLLADSRGELRLTIGWSDDHGTEAEQYRVARERFQQSKARPWAVVATADGQWNVNGLALPPLETPCALCRHASAVVDEWDDDAGVAIRVCRQCKNDGDLGRRLPSARWLVIQDRATNATSETVGLHWAVASSPLPPNDASVLAIANLEQPDARPQSVPESRFWKRRLMCCVPTDSDGVPVWFEHIAKQSRGDALLGVLKADADSVGSMLESLLQSAPTIRPLGLMSRQLDDFFAGKLKHELETNECWKAIYTIFGGGDDLLLVGAWNEMFDFAGRLHELFETGFRRWGLTISAGLALTKWKRPIKFAVGQAEDLLEQAKNELAIGESAPKNQLAAFGQVWKWKDHATIVAEGKRLAAWVDGDVMPRGWLHTLLELAESRFGDPTTNRRPDPLATARLNHHVVRNYRDTQVKNWGDQLVNDFDLQNRIETRYLPAVVRYALTATRNPTQED